MLPSQYREYHPKALHTEAVLMNSVQTMNYNPTTWRVPYDQLVFKDPKQALVSYSLQLLLLLLLYPVPEDASGAAPKNFFRVFLGRLHRPQDFEFLVEGLIKFLNQPVCMYIKAHHMVVDQIFRPPRQALTYRAVSKRTSGHRNSSCYSGKPCSATNASGPSLLEATVATSSSSWCCIMPLSTRVTQLSKAWSECVHSCCRL